MKRRTQFKLLLGLMLFSAVTEVVSLGTVLPFLSVLSAPDLIFNHVVFGPLVRSLGFSAADQLLLPFTILFVVATVVAGLVRLILLWVNTRITFSSGVEISGDVYRKTLYQPYSVHVARHSSDVISGITNKVDGVVFGVILPLLTIVSSTVLLVSIITILVIVHPTAAIAAACSFGICYGAVTWMLRKRLRINSSRISHEHAQVVKALQEGLGGIRDVLLDGTQSVYWDSYHRADKPLRYAQGSNLFIAASPRFAMEVMGMTMIAALAYGLSKQAGGLAAALPVLGALAIGAQRLLPALQSIYGSWTSIVGSQSSLNDVVSLLDQPLQSYLLEAEPAPIVFSKSITLNNLSFRYSNDSPWVINSLNLSIKKGGMVGIVGSTGSGKSTVLDLLMGLLHPTCGEILVDGQQISGHRLRAWQRTIAHVPQNIFLADTSLAENIALGVPKANIDMDRVKSAAIKAQISEFIEKKAEGYQAYVGEYGIRLSGGQRQRIGIARALYKNASVLVFDEATSALDNITEKSVMNSIKELSNELTVIIIAHRLSTVKGCDSIIELENGSITAQGTYDHLVEVSLSFRKMIGSSA